MKYLRSVGGLLAISAALSCATAINDGTVPGPNTPPDGGSDAGGGAGLSEGGSSPATGGSAPQAGGSSPGTGGKGEAGKGSGGTGSGGKGGGTGGNTSKGGSGGVGTGGSSSTGGKAGTGSSGAGPAGGDTGTAGGTSTGPCTNPVDLPAGANGNSGNFNTLEAKCFRTKSTFNNVGCSNFQGRTLKVNNVATTCPAMGTFAPMADGYTYLDASAGSNVSASIYWFTS